MKLTDVQRQMMRHALGLDDSKTGNAYRNRYICGSTAAWDCWIVIAERGFAVPGRPATYHVTRAGFAEVALPGETFDADTFDVVDAIESGERSKAATSVWSGKPGHHARVRAIKARKGRGAGP